MKNILFAIVICVVSSHSYSGAANGLSEALKGYSENLRMEAEADYRQKLELQRMERQHQMDMQKIEMQRKPRTENEEGKRAIDVDRETNERLLEQAHPGWLSIAKSEKFQQWKKKQPQSVQALGDSPHAKDAILMLDIFKRDQ